MIFISWMGLNDLVAINDVLYIYTLIRLLLQNRNESQRNRDDIYNCRI